MAIAIFFLGHWFSSVFFQTFFLHRYGAHKQFNVLVRKKAASKNNVALLFVRRNCKQCVYIHTQRYRHNLLLHTSL